ncbi:hypothetical protein DPMN_042190 [Dreissena polymorpha]|uniref:Uncharacterized protein n=1 Tax=Dreissena polymorpha TaxID=45954 RepID=A0A9D4HUK2_DREPO|nr:hypothetical protein DPMN_042190 [Dreissena polymorpha]
MCFSSKLPGVRFCHEDKVSDHYAGLFAHFNASTRVIEDGIKDAQLSGEFTCTCTITAEEVIELLSVWSKVAAISQDCNKHININTDADSVKFSGCRDSPKESLSQIPAGQQIRLILKTSTEQLQDDDYVIYIAPGMHSVNGRAFAILIMEYTVCL